MSHTAPPPNVVLACLRGSAPSHNPLNHTWKHILWFDLVTTPTAPIQVGQHVQIVALEKLRNPRESHDNQTPTYRSRETDIEGEVIGIRSMEKETVEFIIRNGTKRTTTEIAYLTAEYKPNATIHLTWLQTLGHVIVSRWAPVTRRAPVAPYVIVEGGEQDEEED